MVAKIGLGIVVVAIVALTAVTFWNQHTARADAVEAAAQQECNEARAEVNRPGYRSADDPLALEIVVGRCEREGR